MSNHPIAAAIQLRSGRSVAANISAAVALVNEAVAKGAIYIQLPEMASLIERDRDKLFAAIRTEDADAFLAAMRDAAHKAGVMIHIGSLAVLNGDKVANRAFIVDPHGAIVARYDKIHLYDVDLPNGESWRESATYTAGSCTSVVATPIGKLGVAICYDIRFGHLFRALAEAGAEILTAPAAFTRQTGEAHWHILQRARAIETGSFVISAAQGGMHEDGRETYGHSLIVDPWGRVQIGRASCRERVLMPV